MANWRGKSAEEVAAELERLTVSRQELNRRIDSLTRILASKLKKKESAPDGRWQGNKHSLNWQTAAEEKIILSAFLALEGARKEYTHSFLTRAWNVLARNQWRVSSLDQFRQCAEDGTLGKLKGVSRKVEVFYLLLLVEIERQKTASA